MAGVLGKFSSGEVALSSGVARTVVQLVAASNHRAKLLKVSISGKSASPTDQPIPYKILRQTTAGTSSAGTSGTHYAKQGDFAETLQTGVRVGFSSTEPTAGDVLEEGLFHPQNGVMWFEPLAQEEVIPGGTRLGIQLTPPAAQTVIVSGRWEE